MADGSDGKSTPLGIYDRPGKFPITEIEMIAIALSLVWLLGAAIFFIMLPSEAAPEGTGSLHFLMTMLAILMPVAMIWVAAKKGGKKIPYLDRSGCDEVMENNPQLILYPINSINGFTDRRSFIIDLINKGYE